MTVGFSETENDVSCEMFSICPLYLEYNLANDETNLNLILFFIFPLSIFSLHFILRWFSGSSGSAGAVHLHFYEHFPDRKAVAYDLDSICCLARYW